MQQKSSLTRSASPPAQLLMGLWSRVQTLHPEIKFQIVPFENTPENAREILANLGKNIDVVGGIFDETMLHLRGCAGLELTRGPFHCAVSIHHRLAAKNKLEITDLYGENLLLMHRGWSHYVDQLRDDLWQHHPQIHIVDFEFYSMDVFNRCENSNDVLLAIPGWANVHPLLKVIPVEWEYGIPYGILHSPHSHAHGAAVSGCRERSAARTVRLIITQRYMLMNQPRLLRKPRLFYTAGRSLQETGAPQLHSLQNIHKQEQKPLDRLQQPVFIIISVNRNAGVIARRVCA